MAVRFYGRRVAAASQAADCAAAGSPSCNPEGEADGSDAVGGFAGRTERSGCARAREEAAAVSLCLGSKPAV